LAGSELFQEAFSSFPDVPGELLALDVKVMVLNSCSLFESIDLIQFWKWPRQHQYFKP